MSLTNAANADFTFPVRVYWEDTDAGGIVLYANCLSSKTVLLDHFDTC